MPTPDYIRQIRQTIGHDLLFVPSVTAVIIQPVPAGAPVWEVPQVLLAQRADTGNWAPISGICEPEEDIATTALREIREEIGLEAQLHGILGVGRVGPVTYPNGDRCVFMDTTVRAQVPPGAQPVLGDEENLAAQWFSVAQLPSSVSARHRMVIGDAVAHLRHPAGFRPRLGYTKRSATP